MQIRFATIAATLLGLVLCGPSIAANPQPDADLFRRVAGKWGWKDDATYSCATGPHEITFADNNTRMLFKRKNNEVSTYRILYAEKNMITALIDNEERRTEQGDRVVWVLVLNNPKSYQWRRTDWKSDARTDEIVKCD